MWSAMVPMHTVFRRGQQRLSPISYFFPFLPFSILVVDVYFGYRCNIYIYRMMHREKGTEIDKALSEEYP